MPLERTREQEAAVESRGGELLVSAAAGSGKTRVLVERLLDRVTGEHARIDSFLIITFTRAAAEELRARIARELTRCQGEHPEDSHLRRQTALLYQTQISTVHALCTALLRDWGHLLDIPADFALCEEEEATVLMRRTLDEVLDQQYEALDPEGDFARLLDLLSAGRDDSPLMEIVLDVYGKIQSHPDPEAWLTEQEEQMDLSSVTDAGKTVWGQLLLTDAQQTASYWEKQMDRACALAVEDNALEGAYGDSLSATRCSLHRFILAAQMGWDAAASAEISFPKLKSARKVQNGAAQEQIKRLRDRCKKAAGELTERFGSTSQSLLADMALVYPAMRGLFQLVRTFSAAYTQAKRKKNLLDFSDLEHCALQLLVNQDGSPTELAQQWGGRFTEIMVDEYQDTNQVQNSIFDALSDHGRNLFMVGDVKQSIYRFRLADPTIFLEKYRRFVPYEQAEPGQERKIAMSQNFRSRPQVLEAVNYLFRTILSEQLGEMAYTDQEALHPGGTFPPGDGYETELHVLDFQDDPAMAEAKQSRSLLEARFVAKRIAQLLAEGFPVSDDGAGGTRPLQPGDIAILLRSPGAVRAQYLAALEEQGIPWSSEEGRDFFDTTEISVALAWLQIIDNPRQDIPLLSVLRSPVCGFTGDQLAELREEKREGDIYSALCAKAERGDPPCRAFLEELSALRFGAGELRCHELLWKIYHQTGLLEIFQAMPGGEARRDNLLAFYALARRFESGGHKGLFGFLLHLRRVQESGGRFSVPATAQKQDGVKLLSIHRSKGLEYPVVFLCGLGKRFNETDLRKPVLFHPKLGLGPKGLDRDTMVTFTTLARSGVALALKKEMLAEEMRLLYVAMTRAKEKLILTHALTYGASELKSLADRVSLPAEPQALADCSCTGQWILLSALARPEGGALREAAGLKDWVQPETVFGPDWRIQYHRGAVSQEVARPGGDGQAQSLTPPLPKEEVLRRLTWRYPFAKSSETPAKLTATQAQAEEGDAVLFRQPAPDAGPRPFSRPRFAQEAWGLTPAQRGTALHIVMQNIRLDRTGTEAEIRGEISRLAAENFLTAQQAAAVDSGQVGAFFASDLGREVRGNPTVKREFPFSVFVSANRYFPGVPEGERLLLQGVIDCWFKTEEGITLLDFKTDRVAGPEAVTRGLMYWDQLAAYAYALEELTGMRVVHRLLWFLQANRAVEWHGDEKKGKNS